MKLSVALLAMLSGSSCTSGLTQSYLSSLSISTPLEGNTIYDPLGLYPKNSSEQQNIKPLESNESVTNRPIVDPLNLYSKKITVERDGDMSQSLPFLSRPLHLDGTMVGDVGFDPLGLAAASSERLRFMRIAELKHARIAMIAAVGWPLAELFHTKIASLYGIRPLLMYGDRVPSILNGGLAHAIEPCWPLMAAVLALASVVEIFDDYYRRETNTDSFMNEKRVGANDQYLALSEIKNGRLAMIAVTFYAFQEVFTGYGIIPQIIAWMQPHSADFLIEEGFTSNIQAVLSGIM